MRALGTTIRYAFAGTAVFGVANMVRNLAEMQRQLGQIAAIGSVAGPGGGSIPLTSQMIAQLGSDVRQAAVDSITPVNDFNNAVLNLYSTIQNVPPNQAVEMVKTTARTAQLMQVNVQDAQQAFLQMQTAFRRPHNTAEIKKQQREFFTLISLAPGGPAAGQQIIQQLGPLSSVMAFGRGTQEQMLGLTLASLRGGGTPGTNLRGLQFLLQTIASPGTQTKSSQAALASVGVTPQFIARHGVTAGLMKVLARIRQGGVGGNVHALMTADDASIDNLDASGDPAAAMSNLGITGSGSQFAAKAFHRIHALRIAIRLATQMTRTSDTASIADDLKVITDAANGHVTDVNNVSKAWKRFQNQARLSEAAQAISSMGLDVANTFSPALNFVARGVTGFERFEHRHQREIAYGGTATLAALLLGGRRLLASGLLKGAGGAAIVGTGLVSGDQTRGGSPVNPLFVFVVGQLGNPFQWGKLMAGAAAGTGATAAAEGAAAGAAATTTASRFSRLAKVGSRSIWPLIAVGALYESEKFSRQQEQMDERRRAVSPHSHSLLDYLRHTRSGGVHIGVPGIGPHIGFGGHPNLTPSEQRIFDQLKAGTISADEAEQRLRRVAPTGDLRAAGIPKLLNLKAKANITIKLDQKDPKSGKTTTRNVPVTIDLVPDFTSPAPQTRGQHTTSRGGR